MERKLTMTFSEARLKHIAKLNVAFDRMRDLLADPEMCNPLCPEWKKATEQFDNGVRLLFRLNGIEWEANR